MRVVSQSIPSELFSIYETTLIPAYDWKGATKIRKRPPFRVPQSQGGSQGQGSKPNGSNVSPAQLAQRTHFINSVKCFRKQPESGGATPPTQGPRSRIWWYDASIGSGLFYYNYFMQQSLNVFIGGGAPDWCISTITKLLWVDNGSPSSGFSGHQTFWIENWFGTIRQSYIGNPNGTDATLFIKVKTVDIQPSGDPHGIIQIYALNSQDWYPSLTWDTRPSEGALLFEGDVYAGNGDWMSFNLTGAPSYVIKMVEPDFGDGGTYKKVAFWGYLETPTSNRPYFA